MDGRVSTQVVSPPFSIMAAEYTDITTIEELIICCHRRVESGVTEEHFIEILPLKKANAESIYSTLVEYCRKKNIQLGRLIGMGFDEAATSSGDKIRVQRKLRELSSHASFVTVAVSLNWLLCKLLMQH